MQRHVELSFADGAKAARLLTAIEIMLADGMSDEMQRKLEAAIGSEIIRYPEPIRSGDLALLAREVRHRIEAQLPADG